MKELRIALDWTANTNHSGFFVAKAKGFYSDLNLAVEIVTPDSDDYAMTPAKKVELGLADFALCPFESIVSYRTKKNTFDAVALAAIFREDLSAIVTLEEGSRKRPKDLDGARYASYQARYEDEIVRQMIKNDGGEGRLEVGYPKKLGIWETVLAKTYDATWIFTNWEGIQAKTQGVALNAFKMADYGIPYGYSPVIMASRKAVDQNKRSYTDFLEATKKGFLFAQANTTAAVNCLAPFVSKQDSDIDLLKSQEFTAPFYGTAENWGVLEEKEVNRFLDWLMEHDLEHTRLTSEDLVYRNLI